MEGMVMAKKKETEVEKKVTKKKENIDTDLLKEELYSYIDESIKKNFNLELERSYKRTIRDKNIKIIVKNMVITILLLVIVYLVYILNDNNYFDKFFVEDNSKDGNKVSELIDRNEDNKEEEVEEEKKPTLDELKKQYSYLLEGIYINEDATYVNDYYNGKLTNELKNYLTMNMMDLSSLSNDNGYNIIENDTFRKCYEKKFVGDYLTQNFNYNGNNFRYINQLDSYITDEVVKENRTNIKRIITKIDVDGDKILITTVEGVARDNKLYNILTNEEVSDYSDKMMLENIDKLNKVVYVFNTDDKLIEIDK